MQRTKAMCQRLAWRLHGVFYGHKDVACFLPVVVQLDELGEVVVHDLSHQHCRRNGNPEGLQIINCAAAAQLTSITEVPSDIALRPAQGDLVDLSSQSARQVRTVS